jgi:hypothetical protein
MSHSVEYLAVFHDHVDACKKCKQLGKSCDTALKLFEKYWTELQWVMGSPGAKR